jgi:hypothetical protein
MVDPTGNATPTKAETIAAEATTTDTFSYDVAATRIAHLMTQRVNASGTVQTSLVDARWRYVMFAPSGSYAPRKFDGGTAVTTIPGAGLFPFTSAYALYAGDCTGARPADAVASTPRPAVPTSALATDPGEAIVVMPVINITVLRNATGSAVVGGARIYLTARSGDCSGTYQLPGTTDAITGRLSVDGAGAMPFGTYDLCVLDGNGKQFKEAYVAPVGVIPAKGVDNTGPAGFSKTVRLTGSGTICP